MAETMTLEEAIQRLGQIEAHLLGAHRIDDQDTLHFICAKQADETRSVIALIRTLLSAARRLEGGGWQAIETCPVENTQDYRPRLGAHVLVPVTTFNGRRIIVEFDPVTHEAERWIELPPTPHRSCRGAGK